MTWDLLLLAVIVFLIAMLPRILAARVMDMTWDEGTYTFCGSMALKNLANRNFSPEAWRLEFHAPFMMYFYGLAYGLKVFFGCIRSGHIKLEKIIMESSKSFKGQSTLFVIRLPAIIFGSLTSVTIFFLANMLFHDSSQALFAALFFALTPIVIGWSSIAMLEVGLMFFSTSSILFLLLGLQYHSLPLIALSGMLGGLVAASKENGFLFLGSIAFWWLLAILLFQQNFWLPPYLLMFAWALSIIFAYYASWPWLWRSPIKNFLSGIRSISSTLDTWELAGRLFYVKSFLTTNPLWYPPLIFIGTISFILSLFTNHDQLIMSLFFLWFYFPILVSISKKIPKRVGIYQLAMIFPPLSILMVSGLKELSTTLLLDFHALSILIILATVILAFKISPYYLSYYNILSKYLDKGKFRLVGWWGDGMGRAIRFVDLHAKKNSLILVYGPKSTAIYHSSRVNLRKTLRGYVFYHAETKGLSIEIDPSIYDTRAGDLIFYFPYYESEDLTKIISHEDILNSVEYVVIYHWALTDPSMNCLNEMNYNFVRNLVEKQKPTYTSYVLSEPVCLVYDKNSFSEALKSSIR